LRSYSILLRETSAVTADGYNEPVIENDAVNLFSTRSTIAPYHLEQASSVASEEIQQAANLADK